VSFSTILDSRCGGRLNMREVARRSLTLPPKACELPAPKIRFASECIFSRASASTLVFEKVWDFGRLEAAIRDVPSGYCSNVCEKLAQDSRCHRHVKPRRPSSQF
jgi:hypothetical protein